MSLLTKPWTAAVAAACVVAAPQLARADCRLIELADFHVDLTDGSPMVDGAINGKPVKIRLDSGADTSTIMRNSADRLGLIMLDSAGRMLGIGGDTELYVAKLKSLSIDKFTTGRLDLTVAGDRDAKPDFDILLGDDFLSQFDVEFDFADHAVRLFQPQGCQPAQLVYWNKPYAQAELVTWDWRFPKTEVHVQLNGHSELALLDSGAPLSLVDATEASAVGAHADERKITELRGIGPRLRETWTARFDRLAIGEEVVGNPRLNTAPLRRDLGGGSLTGSRLDELAPSTPSVLIGDDFLQSHRVLVANHEHVLLFSYIGGHVFAEPDDMASLDQEVRLHPDDIRAYERREDIELDQEHWDDAVKDQSQIVRLSPADADALAYRAALYTQLGNFGLAIEDLDAALKLEPGAYLLFNNRCWARALARQGLEQALADCNAGIAAKPGDSAMMDSRAFVFFQMGQYVQAIADANAALKLNPKEASSLYLRGLANRRLGNAAQADADIAAAKAMNPKVETIYAKANIAN